MGEQGVTEQLGEQGLRRRMAPGDRRNRGRAFYVRLPSVGSTASIPNGPSGSGHPLFAFAGLRDSSVGQIASAQPRLLGDWLRLAPGLQA
jgi:hypothetical protein